jgi:hypothetical protein
MPTHCRNPSLRWLVAAALLLLGSATCLAAEVTLVPGTDLMGGDYKAFALDAAQPEACRQACAGDARCKAYTYVVPGVKGPSAMCYLKDSLPPSTSDACCTSGKKIVAIKSAAAPVAPSAATLPTHAAPPIHRAVLAPSAARATGAPQRAVLPSAPRILAGPPKPCTGSLHVDAAAVDHDQHDGSVEFPFATINAAIASATARKCSLDLVLAPGTYVEDVDVQANFSLKGADKSTTRIQGSLRAVGNFKTLLWDIGFDGGSPLAIYKEGGTIQMLRVAVSDIRYVPTAGIASPGAVQIVNASGVVSGLVATDVSSPALLVEGPSARIKVIALVVSDSEPAVAVTGQLRSVGAVEVRDQAAVMGAVWKVFDNQLFGILVTTGASLYLSSGEVTNTAHAVGSVGPDNLIVASQGILEIDHVISTGAERAGALAASGYFTAHHSKLQSNAYGFVDTTIGTYPDPRTAERCATADDVLISGNLEQGIVSPIGSSLAVPNAPLCVPGKEDQPECADTPAEPDLQACKVALRW